MIDGIIVTIVAEPLIKLLFKPNLSRKQSSYLYFICLHVYTLYRKSRLIQGSIWIYLNIKAGTVCTCNRN